MSHFLYKGIDVIFTDGADSIAPSEEERINVLEFFFKDNSVNDIKWVTKKEAMGQTEEDAFQMYHMTNPDDETLLFWPLLDEEQSNLALIVEDLKERPDVVDEIEKGYD